MKKKNQLIVGISITLIIIATIVFFKFNETGASNDNHQIVYISKSGEKVGVNYTSDDIVEVHFIDRKDIFSNAFTAKRIQSASGTKYKTLNGKFSFWNKGESALIHNKDKLIFSGTIHPDKPKEQWFSGKLIFEHELQIFQKCKEQNEFWVSDPQNLIQERYDSLTIGKEPYTAIYAEIVGIVSTVEESEDGFASEYKKQLTVTDIIMDTLEKYSECVNDKVEETIYYSEVLKKWRDNKGDCNTCTPENGFGNDGIVNNIAWRELWLTLNNDAYEPPSIQELKTFFKEQYAEKSSYYPVHIHPLKQENSFAIKIPVPKELKDMNFFALDGALLATYDVIEHRWNNNNTVNFIRYPKEITTSNKEKAKAYAEQTKIYIQDGHNLRLRNPQLYKCSSCYDFVFDHYGDPNIPYYISVRVNGDGTFDEIKTKRQD